MAMAAGSTSEGLMARIRRWMRPAETGPTPPAPPNPAPAPAASFDYEDDRIPAASRSRVTDVLGMIARIEEQSAKASAAGRPAGEAVQQARAIRERYLPDLLGSYFAIPPEHRSEFFRRTGKSASIQLNERIDVLIDELRGISAALADGHIDEFAQHLKFIDQRFDPADPWR
jgi:hypothetical protein